MKKMMCSICGHVFDPVMGDAGVNPGTPFEAIPEDWHCPICGASKPKFVPVD